MEHPAYEDSWKIEAMEEFMKLDGVAIEIGDRRIYGLKTPSQIDGSPTPARKPTKLLSYSWCTLQELCTISHKSHVRQHLVRGRGAKAAEYPDGLCEGFCKGFAGQLAYDRSGRVCSGPLKREALTHLMVAADAAYGRASCLDKPRERVSHAPDGGALGYPEPWSKPRESHQFPAHWSDTKHEPDGTPRELLVTADESESVIEERFGSFRIGENDGEKLLKMEMNALMRKHNGAEDCWDDVTGAQLVTRLVKEARSVEMSFFKRMGVFTEYLDRDEVKKRGGKMIRGRWIDSNKGDSACPDYRSRFVGKEFNVRVDPELYAATPPLEALELLLGHVSANKRHGIHLGST